MRRRVGVLIVGISALIVIGVGSWYFKSRTVSRSEVSSKSGVVALGLDNDEGSQTISLSSDVPKSQSSLSVTSDVAGQLQGLEGGTAENNEQVDFKQFEQYGKSESSLYRDLVQGDGAEAVVGKKLAVNYRGWLTSGELFDEATKKVAPFEFVLGEHKVIAGFETGIAGMRVGGKRLVIVPPALGYGNKPMGGIPAESVLIFEAELLSVE